MSLIKKSHQPRTWADKLTIAVFVREGKEELNQDKVSDDPDLGDLHSDAEILLEEDISDTEDTPLEKDKNLHREENCHGVMHLRYCSFNLQELLRRKLILKIGDTHKDLYAAKDPLGENNFIPDSIWKKYPKEIEAAKEDVYEHVWQTIKNIRNSVLKKLRARNDGKQYSLGDYFLLTDFEAALDFPLPYGYDPVKSQSFKTAFSGQMIESREGYHSNPPSDQVTDTCHVDEHQLAYDEGFLEIEPLNRKFLNTLAPIKSETTYHYKSSRPFFEVTMRNRTSVVGYVKHVPKSEDLPQYWLYRLEHRYRSYGSGKKAPAKIRDALKKQNHFSSREGLQNLCEALYSIHFNNMNNSFSNIAVQMTPREKFQLVKDGIQDVIPHKSLDVIMLLITGNQHISENDIIEKGLCRTQIRRAHSLDLLTKSKTKESCYVINWAKFRRQMHEEELLAAGADLLFGD